MKKERVFVIGGAGFLGYHICHELLNRSHKVGVLALENEEVDSSLTQNTTIVRGNVDTMSDEALKKIFSQYTRLVYAAGPDDRAHLKPGVDAAEFFQENLVERTERVAKIAKQSGVKAMIILGSYFSYINDQGICGVEKESLERHPYIKARVMQSAKAFVHGSNEFRVATLNIPYVFGVTPKKTTIWKRIFVDDYANSPKIYYGSGGTTVLSVYKVAYSTAQALEHAKHAHSYPIGSADKTFEEIIVSLLKAALIEKPVKTLPAWLLGLLMRLRWYKQKKAHIDSGLDLRYLARDIMSKDFYINYSATDEELYMTDFVDDVDEAIRVTGESIR